MQHQKNQHSTNNNQHLQLSFKKRHKQLAYGKNYIPEEETIRNDYSLHYVLTGSRPQNQIQNTALSTRFAEYPKLKKLLELKKSQVSHYSHPPMYIQADLRPAPYPNSFNLLDLLPTRFDVIVIDPPLQEYVERFPHLLKTHPEISKSGGTLDQERPYWSWDELENLPIPSIAASPGFIFLWCGSGQGSTLESGRSLLSKWGYRKCEDLVWVKTNHHDSNSTVDPDSHIPAVFTSTKEHCLMGIRGTVRRSTDGHFVHCNVDTDVIVSETDPTDVLHKPEELYQLTENFCLGRRRLDLFGSSKTLRPGWLTIGNESKPAPSLQELTPTSPIHTPIPYDKSKYLNFFLDNSGRTQNLLPTNTDVENLRPRSPPSRMVPGITSSGIALSNGRGYLPGTIPIIGSDGNILGNTISGRNTISHPSGGLGRGPGNALLPGMRVSGSRDSNNSANNINNNTNYPRVFNQMHPTFVNLSLLHANHTPQRTNESYTLLPTHHTLNPPTWTRQPIVHGPPATGHSNHHLSTTTDTSYPPFPHQPPVHSSFYPPHPFYLPPSAHTIRPYNPHFLLPEPHQYHHHHQQQQQHVGYPTHHHFPSPGHQFHPSRDNPSHPPFPSHSHLNLDPTPNTFLYHSSPAPSSNPSIPNMHSSPSYKHHFNSS